MYNADGVSLVDFYPVGAASCRDVILGPAPDHLLQWLTGPSISHCRETVGVETNERTPLPGLNQWVDRVADANAYNEAFGFWCVGAPFSYSSCSGTFDAGTARATSP
jgi:hypothetical protein